MWTTSRLSLTLGINRVWSIRLPLLTSHRTAAVKTLPVAQMELWKAIKKALGFDSKDLAQSTVEAYLSPQQCFSLLVLPLQRLDLFLVHLLLFFLTHFCRCMRLSQPVPTAASIKAVKAPQPIDSLIEYHNYQQLTCTVASVKNR